MTKAILAVVDQQMRDDNPPETRRTYEQLVAHGYVPEDARRLIGNVVASVRARLDTLIATLTAELAALDAEIATTLVQDDAWAEAAARLQTITGVGMITTAWLLTATLNFTRCPTPEAATAYAGLAPHAYQSGTSVQKRPTIGHTGHARLRTVLYLASLSAAQHNPAIKPFYDRLRAAGKSATVARCAAARKVLHIAWAVVTKRQSFDPQYHERHVQTMAAPLS